MRNHGAFSPLYNQNPEANLEITSENNGKVQAETREVGKSDLLAGVA